MFEDGTVISTKYCAISQVPMIILRRIIGHDTIRDVIKFHRIIGTDGIHFKDEIGSGVWFNFDEFNGIFPSTLVAGAQGNLIGSILENTGVENDGWRNMWTAG